VPGFIKRFCTPNAILTLAEYIVDYATPEVGNKAWKIIDKEIKGLDNEKVISQLKERIDKIKNGERDLYF
jgi:2-iminoacetate synthase